MSAGAALLIGTVGYGVYLMAGPPVSFWSRSPWLTIVLVAVYPALTAAAWYQFLKKTPAGPARALFLVAAVVGTATLAVFLAYNAFVIALSFVLAETL